MKKYMIMCLAVVAMLLASCKNEDISISREVNFEINPYTVVKDFAKHELYAGDLSTVYWYDYGDKLRVQLFVYDDRGYLVESVVNYLDNYTSNLHASLDLSDGSYKVLVITDEVGLNGNQVNDEYWFITGTERLTNLRITSNTEWNEFGVYKKLGITQKAISVNANNKAFSIDVTPAGAIMQSWIYNIQGFIDVLEYSLWMDKKNGNYSFNDSGVCEVGYEQTNFTSNIRSDKPKDYTAGNIYDYHFFVPYGNTGFEWHVLLDDGNYYYLLDDVYVNIMAGKSYSCILDIDGNNSSFIINELSDSKTLASTGDSVGRVHFKDKSECRVKMQKPVVVKQLER